MTIQTGDGGDTVYVTSSFADKMSVDLGSGDDSLNVADTVAHQAAFNGGAGTGDKFSESNCRLDYWTLTGFDSPWKPLTASAVDAVFARGY